MSETNSYGPPEPAKPDREDAGKIKQQTDQRQEQTDQQQSHGECRHQDRCNLDEKHKQLSIAIGGILQSRGVILKCLIGQLPL